MRKTEADVVHCIRERECLEVARVVDLPSLIVGLRRGLDERVISGCGEMMRMRTRSVKKPGLTGVNFSRHYFYCICEVLELGAEPLGSCAERVTARW